MNTRILLCAACLAVAGTGSAVAAPLSVELKATPTNPASPRMGDTIAFTSVIRNTGDKPLDGVIAWISLVQVDPGKEQPVDLEDWSAHKAIAERTLAPGAALSTEWPIRLIQAGTYPGADPSHPGRDLPRGPQRRHARRRRADPVAPHRVRRPPETCGGVRSRPP